MSITLLSEKAELLKKINKNTKDSITSEDFRIKGVLDANKKFEEQTSGDKDKK